MTPGAVEHHRHVHLPPAPGGGVVAVPQLEAGAIPQRAAHEPADAAEALDPETHGEPVPAKERGGRDHGGRPSAAANQINQG
ncbi:hypothetical protein [Cyanobium sp. NIES-981]|uniref:hypothetical protein n=1 Tax=Cyanobium sp. NIES-981 TaxID=1851505 RepID=UPI001CEDC4CC|nr:hypothetical protein [Cyanobium sp. NIES-981]